MNAGELINALAERTGYMSDELKTLLAAPALTQITLPDDFKKVVNTNLMTIAEAKLNPEIKAHWRGTFLKTVDDKVAELLEEYGLPDDSRNVITGEANTFEKIKLLTKAVADVKEEAAKAVGGDKAKLVDEINKLNSAINTLKDQAKAEVGKVNSDWQGKVSDMIVNGKFKGYDYAMDTIPSEVQASSARTLFESKLAEKGGRMKYQDGKMVLVSATDEALPFTLDNKPVVFEDFADQVVSEYKLIKVKGQQQQQQQQTQQQQQQQQVVQKVVAPAGKLAVSQALKDLENN